MLTNRTARPLGSDSCGPYNFQNYISKDIFCSHHQKEEWSSHGYSFFEITDVVIFTKGFAIEVQSGLRAFTKTMELAEKK